VVYNVQTVRTKRPQKAQHLTRYAAGSVSAAEREIWSARDIMHRWNISEVTFWRYRKKGYVPAPDAKIGPRDAWYRDTILAAERTGIAAAS
jgi:hypothetical protein